MPLDAQRYDYQDLIKIFEQTFYQQYQTRLIKGIGEPVYLPQDEQSSDNRIIFAHGYYASALHEIAHWLVAGFERRKIEDFGYWYKPDGRTIAQQATFEAVEVKPQAIEWLLCVATGFDFNVSCDNLSGEPTDRLVFQHNVYQQVKHLLENGYNKRVEQLVGALAGYYQTALPLSLKQFEYQGINELVA
ncbi:MAG: elongation factor P hydroxylase [Alteromonadaceae bacterium]|jgi:elongation factor P hydroxylase